MIRTFKIGVGNAEACLCRLMSLTSMIIIYSLESLRFHHKANLWTAMLYLLCYLYLKITCIIISAFGTIPTFNNKWLRLIINDNDEMLIYVNMYHINSIFLRLRLNLWCSPFTDINDFTKITGYFKKLLSEI